MSAGSSPGYVICCCLERTSHWTVVFGLVIVLQSFHLKFSTQQNKKPMKPTFLEAELHYPRSSQLSGTTPKNVSELLTVCSRPKAYYAMYLSKYATLTSQTSYTAVTPSNPFCELIINALGRPPLEALNRESKPLQRQTIWRGPASLCCTEIILFWRIWMVIS